MRFIIFSNRLIIIFNLLGIGYANTLPPALKEWILPIGILGLEAELLGSKQLPVTACLSRFVEGTFGHEGFVRFVLS